MSDYTRSYTVGAFLLGVAIAVAYNGQITKHDSQTSTTNSLLKKRQNLDAKFSNINDLDSLKKRIGEIETSLQEGAGNIKEGIEGCIGSTPLIKIKSLSEYTGCEILAKAEVELLRIPLKDPSY